MKFPRLVPALLLLLGPALAHAQTTPGFQSGTAVANSVAKLLANGSYGTAGDLTGDANGRGVNPFAVRTSADLGLVFVNTANISDPHVAFGFGHDADGNGLIKLYSAGGAAEKAIECDINGVVAPCTLRADGTTITVNSSGVISAVGGAGGVGSVTSISITAGTGLTGTPSPITTTGSIACDEATDAAPGCVQVDGTTITAAAGVISASASGLGIGDVTVSTQTAATYTLQSSDCGYDKLLRIDRATAVTVTMPNNLPAGCRIRMAQIGAGQILLVAGAGATGPVNAHGYTKSFGQGAVIDLDIDTNAGGTAANYILSGDGA